MDEFVIRVRPKHIERLIFVTIIIILLGVIFWQRTALPGTDVSTAEDKTAASAVAQTGASDAEASTEADVESGTEAEAAVDDTAEEDAEDATAEEDTPAEEDNASTTAATGGALPGKRTFTVTDIKVTKDADDDDLARMDSFNLKISNGLAGVYITYKVYIYASGDDPSEFPDQTVTLPKIAEGEIYEKVQNWGGEPFRNIDEDKKLKVVFFDSSNKELDVVIGSFKAS